MNPKSFSISVAALLFMVFQASPVHAQKYLGEITWNGSDSQHPSYKVQAALSYVGSSSTASYYEVQGMVTGMSGVKQLTFSGGGVWPTGAAKLKIVATFVQVPTSNTTYPITGTLNIGMDATTFDAAGLAISNVTYIPEGSSQLDTDCYTFPKSYPGGGKMSLSLTGLGNPPASLTLTPTSKPFPLK